MCLPLLPLLPLPEPCCPALPCALPAASCLHAPGPPHQPGSGSSSGSGWARPSPRLPDKPDCGTARSTLSLTEIYFLRPLGVSTDVPHQILQCVTLTSLSELEEKKKGPRSPGTSIHTEKMPRRATKSQGAGRHTKRSPFPMCASLPSHSAHATGRRPALHSASCTPPARRVSYQSGRRKAGMELHVCMSAVPEPEQQQCKVRPGAAPLAGRAPPQTRDPHVFGVGPVSAPAESRSSPELSISLPNLTAILGP